MCLTCSLYHHESNALCIRRELWHSSTRHSYSAQVSYMCSYWCVLRWDWLWVLGKLFCVLPLLWVLLVLSMWWGSGSIVDWWTVNGSHLWGIHSCYTDRGWVSLNSHSSVLIGPEVAFKPFSQQNTGAVVRTSGRRAGIREWVADGAEACQQIGER